MPRNIQFINTFLVSTCIILLASCAPDLRKDVTNNPDANVPFDELQPWPKADSDGIFQFDNRRYIEVRYGENLFDVAKRADEDPLVIAELNKISSDYSLPHGKVLLLPPRVSSTNNLENTNNDVSETDQSDFEIDIRGKTENYYRHRVQKGETAFTIANLYEISVRTLADWNELEADFAVMEGEVLIIPATDNGVAENVQENPSPEPTLSEVPEVVEKPVSAETVETEKKAETTNQETEVLEETEAPEEVVTEPKPLAKIDCNNFEPAQFGFNAPLQGELVQDYSNQPGENKGLDISAPIGSPVFAAGKGKVALISDLAEGTKVLLVLHECNVFSIYQNIQDITLERGDQVEKGKQIGTLDSAIGYLHFEIRVGPDATDPKRYLPSNSYTN